jgi:hypothetical protein
MPGSWIEPNSEEALREAAETLVRVAVRAFMKTLDVDRETAERWILNAAMALGEEVRRES